MSEAVAHLLREAAKAAENQEDDSLLLVPEIAALARVPLDTVRFWRKAGSGPPMFRLGRRVVARRSAVLAWIAEREAADSPPSTAA
jgi:predicted DNA-binding transcriptional regulator AlpA